MHCRVYKGIVRRRNEENGTLEIHFDNPNVGQEVVTEFETQLYRLRSPDADVQIGAPFSLNRLIRQPQGRFYLTNERNETTPYDFFYDKNFNLLFEDKSLDSIDNPYYFIYRPARPFIRSCMICNHSFHRPDDLIKHSRIEHHFDEYGCQRPR